MMKIKVAILRLYVYIKRKLFRPIVFLWSAISASLYILFEIKSFLYNIFLDKYQPISSEIYAFIILLIIFFFLVKYIIKSIKIKSWRKEKSDDIDL